MNSSSVTRVKGFLLDLDGTLYLGDRLFEQTPAFIETLGRLGLPFVCLTNNSSANANDYLKKLNAMGVGVVAEQVMTSGDATIHYLLSATEHRSAYVVGTEALRRSFVEAGIVLDESDPDCLVLGYDTTVDYQKLCVATRLLFAEKPYYATHPDKTCITEAGLLPDIAATIAGLQAVTGRSPMILGKPELAIVEAAAARIGVAKDDLAMVGDQLDTDMTMAKRHGLLGILLLSGETSAQRAKSDPLKPDLVLDGIGELAALLDDAHP